MAVRRAVNLKLVVPRRPDGLSAARALWSTHAAVNEATHRYERILLLCRQRDYETGDGAVAADAMAPELDRLISAARERNRYSGPPRTGETKERLRRLYEEIAPSSVGNRGTAQKAGAFVSPLTDPESRGFEAVFDKIGNPPDWIDGVRAGEARAVEEANRWLESSAGRERLRPTGKSGRPARWMLLARRKDPGWPSEFVADFDRKKEEAQGAPTLTRELRGLGVLPLFPAHFAPPRIGGQGGAVSPWDRLAFRLAVGHLLSWESWASKAQTQHDEREARLERFREDHAGGDMAEIVEALRGYERERAGELREEQRGRTDVEAGEARVTPRTVRGWGDLREKWLEKPDAGADELISIANDEQARRRGGFGDPRLFRWLARDGRRFIWNDRDGLSLFARLRAMELLVERSRETARMTLPDALRHPRTAQWEPRGGANLKNHRLEQDGEGRLSVALPLLRRIEGDRYVEEEHVFPLAKSAQIANARLDREGKKWRLTYETPTGETAEAEVGSADLLMDWYALRQRGRERAEAGDIGPAFLKVALDVRPIDPVGDPRKTPPAIHHFGTASGRNTRHAGGVEAGFRVLSVDLGVRNLAACSVFELKEEPAAGKPAFPVAHLDLCAVHERSFLLNLPGETPGRRDLDWRDGRDRELRRLRWALARYRALRGLDDAPPARRREALDGLRERADDEGWPFETRIAEGLSSLADEPEPVWTKRLDAALRDWRGAFGSVVREWRRGNRARSEGGGGGKSMWAIRRLTDTRRFLQGWSLLSERGETRRHDNEASGIFGKHLLDHLDALKEDRRKTGADLIVQAARGWRRDKAGRWEKAHAPCHAILFEDLTRYRMRTDRPRRENDRLMKWAHRAIREEAEMQAEPHGVHVADTGAAFSSRFHAETRTPGVRVHPVRKRDLSDPWMLDRIEERNPGLDRERLKPGDLVRMDGGELFACPTREGAAATAHADINAARNLQRRFFTRHGDAFRIVAFEAALPDGGTVWLPRSPGKRLLGALEGHGRLVPTGHESGSCRFEGLSPRDWARLSGEDAAGAPAADGEDDDVLAELDMREEEALERTGEIAVFFRDPSGVVLPNDLWYPRKVFWGVVARKTLSALRRAA